MASSGLRRLEQHLVQAKGVWAAHFPERTTCRMLIRESQKRHISEVMSDRNKSCSDPVFPVIQIPASCHSLLAEGCIHIHHLAHSNFCESLEFLQLGLRRLLSLRIVNKRSSNSPRFSWLSKYSSGSSSSVPDIVTPSIFIHRTSICELSPRGCFACGGTASAVGSAARLVGVDDQTRAFGLGVGNAVNTGTTETLAPITNCG